MSRARPIERGRWDRRRLRAAAARILKDALDAAEPSRLLHQSLRLKGGVLEAAGKRYSLGRGHLMLIAAGKAASPMAAAAHEILGRRLHDALAVDTSALRPLPGVRRFLAAHPLPDERGLKAALEVERLATGLSAQDTLLVLLSGGASALLPAPAPGISLADTIAATALLIRAGAGIHELNAVRKHLSRLKGGGLARVAAPARVVGLALSDVVGDDLATIASGPTAPDPTTYSQAIAILKSRGVWSETPSAVRAHLARGEAGTAPETPKPGDTLFRRVSTAVIGNNRLSLLSAARAARGLGLRALILSSCIEGEAREIARALTAVLRECVETGQPASPPICLLAGGETTVTVRGRGRGGRNQEFVLAAASALAAFPAHAVVASLGTDGRDGASEAAGGVSDQKTLARARALGLAPIQQFLADNDSSSFLATLGDQIVTGPTGTNVCDIMILLAGDRLARLSAQ